MAIDPKKMKAFVGGGQGGDEGGGKPDGGGGPKSNPDDMQEGGDAAGKFSDLIPLLEENSGDIEDAANMVNADPGDVLSGGEEPDQAHVGEAMSGFDSLDDDLKGPMGALKGVSVQDAEDLAHHLADEGMVEDAELVAAWLYLVGCGMGHGGDEGEDDGGDEGDTGDEEDDGGDEGY